MHIPEPAATALSLAPLPVENLFSTLLENEVTDKSADPVIGNYMQRVNTAEKVTPGDIETQRREEPRGEKADNLGQRENDEENDQQTFLFHFRKNKLKYKTQEDDQEHGGKVIADKFHIWSAIEFGAYPHR